jgi:hypothetical protein
MARIRTIKPEFWQNETLASLPEHARLLAIALLNHADDAGMFLANAALVRAACFPFEEHSKNVLGSLQELSRIGYIEVRDCDGKQVGKVCKFLEHQRIDKPQKSKLLAVFEAFPSENNDSKNIPRTFQEPSQNDPRLERKGKEGNGTGEQGKGNVSPKSAGIEKPPEVTQQAWDDWAATRKVKRAGPVTQTALAMIEREAASANISLQEAVEMAAGSGWITFKAEYMKGTNQPRAPVTFAQQRELNTVAAGESWEAKVKQMGLLNES